MASALLSSSFVLEIFLYALMGGLLPALLWLWFWLHEGHKHKEPHHVILLTFVFGMLGVFAVYPLQSLALKLVPGAIATSPLIILIWAFIEEGIKLLAAYIFAFRTPDVYDEPIDAFVYLVTAALGFAAMENTLFLLTPLLQGDTLGTVMTGNLRFMGANLLHVVSSGLLALFVGYSYYMKGWKKREYIILGLITASLLHTFFNFFIISSEQQSLFLVFSFVWMTTILLILALERIKLIKKF